MVYSSNSAEVLLKEKQENVKWVIFRKAITLWKVRPTDVNALFESTFYFSGYTMGKKVKKDEKPPPDDVVCYGCNSEMNIDQ